MRRDRLRATDRGSASLLIVGLVAVCLLAFVVLVDASAAFLQRRQLVAIADAAALAGAQGIDLEEYYRSGASAATRLDPSLVVARVRRHLTRSGAAAIPGLALDEVVSDGADVQVDLSAPLRLPFLADAFPVRVSAGSDARLSFRPG